MIGNANPLGITPTMACGTPPMRIVLPTISGSAPNSDCHRSNAMTATAGPSGRSSSSTNGLPRNGGTRSMRKADGLIRAARTDRARPSAEKMTRWCVVNVPTSSSDSSSRRQASMSPRVCRPRLPPPTSTFQIPTTRSPSGTGRCGPTKCSVNAWNPATVAIAMDMASVPTSVSPGYLRSMRTPSFRSSSENPRDRRPMLETTGRSRRSEKGRRRQRSRSRSPRKRPENTTASRQYHHRARTRPCSRDRRRKTSSRSPTMSPRRSSGSAHRTRRRASRGG